MTAKTRRAEHHGAHLGPKGSVPECCDTIFHDCGQYLPFFGFYESIV